MDRFHWWNWVFLPPFFLQLFMFPPKAAPADWWTPQSSGECSTRDWSVLRESSALALLCHFLFFLPYHGNVLCFAIKKDDCFSSGLITRKLSWKINVLLIPCFMCTWGNMSVRGTQAYCIFLRILRISKIVACACEIPNV